MNKFLAKIFILCPLILSAYEGPVDDTQPIHPWFTGPLLGGSANVVPPGHINFEPYFFAFARTAFYNSDWHSQSIDTLWTLQWRTPLWIGLIERVDMRIIPVWNWNERNGQNQWTLGDCAGQLSVQILKEPIAPQSWIPSMKLSFRETFPTGKYDHFNPRKFGTDGGGNGTWLSSLALTLSKMIYLENYRFLNLNLNLVGAIPTKVKVKGYNTYGGGVGTNGVVTPETSGLINFAFEYSFSRNWALACDFQGLWNSKVKFKGKEGMIPPNDAEIDPEGLPASNERDASILYSIAPAIEYNWSENLGLIGGVWFSLAGKNSSRFTTGVIALNYYR